MQIQPGIYEPREQDWLYVHVHMVNSASDFPLPHITTSLYSVRWMFSVFIQYVRAVLFFHGSFVHTVVEVSWVNWWGVLALTTTCALWRLLAFRSTFDLQSIQVCSSQDCICLVIFTVPDPPRSTQAPLRYEEDREIRLAEMRNFAEVPVL